MRQYRFHTPVPLQLSAFPSVAGAVYKFTTDNIISYCKFSVKGILLNMESKNVEFSPSFAQYVGCFYTFVAFCKKEPPSAEKSAEGEPLIFNNFYRNFCFLSQKPNNYFAQLFTSSSVTGAVLGAL